MQFLYFRISKKWFAIDVMQVRKITKLKTTAPGKSIEFNENHIPLIKLDEYLFRMPIEISSDRKILITSYDNRLSGFIVDSAEEIVQVPDENIIPPKEIPSDLVPEFLGGIIPDDNRKIYIISRDSITRFVEAF